MLDSALTQLIPVTANPCFFQNPIFHILFFCYFYGQVFIAMPGQPQEVVQRLTVYQNSVVVNNLIPYTIYSFRAQYINAVGSGQLSAFGDGMEPFIIRTREAGIKI